MLVEDFEEAYALALAWFLAPATKAIADLVRGIGIGIAPGSFDPANLCLKIYITEHSPLEILMPALTAFGVPVQTVVTGEFEFLNGTGAGGDGNASARPGSKIERKNGNGTLGAVVVDNSGDRFLLSCSHTLEGDGPVLWVQPGNTQTIATEVRIIPLNQAVVPADAGIARITGNVSAAFPIPIEPQAVNAVIGRRIRHFGAVTNPGVGIIRDVRVHFKVPDDGAERIFESAALADPGFADGGDSGSVVIDTDAGNPMGIVAARATGTDQVAICSLVAALDVLKVKLVTS